MAAIDNLTHLIVNGFPDSENRENFSIQVRNALNGLFADRFKHAEKDYQARVVFPPNGDVSFAGLVHPDNPTSGVYGGMSWIWFPNHNTDSTSPCAMITLVVGTRGLNPDETILGRPGHRRTLYGLSQYLAHEHDIRLWVKHDPTNLTQDLSTSIRREYPEFKAVFDKYGPYIYAIAPVPSNISQARTLIQSLLDFYANERFWQVRKSVEQEFNEVRQKIQASIFPKLNQQDIISLLYERRFVIIEGPPGTGKTRVAKKILQEEFFGTGMSVQFHPAVSYEQFVAGISPVTSDNTLHFRMTPGILVQAIRGAKLKSFLLHIDEINRADLGRILGEAIYLFEPREISNDTGHSIQLSQPLDDGTQEITIPKNLYVLGTMNSADRSIAILDLAVRRRFAFVQLWPDLAVVEEQGIDQATEAFVRLQDIFVQYAPDDALFLLPGHSYFLANSNNELSRRFQYELLPLLNEYLQDGRLGSCEYELRAYIDWLKSEILANA